MERSTRECFGRLCVKLHTSLPRSLRLSRGEEEKTELWRRWCERRKEVRREEETEGLGGTEAGAGAYRVKALEVAREFKRRTWREAGGLGRRFPGSVGDPGAPAWGDSHGPTCSSPESRAGSQGNGATASALPKERVTIYSGLRFSLKLWLRYLLCRVSMGFSSPSISRQIRAYGYSIVELIPDLTNQPASVSAYLA